MAIYKSSFKKEPEKKVKEKKLKTKKAEKPTSQITHKKANVPLICCLVFASIFVLCCLPNNFFKSFVLGVFGLAVYPVCACTVFVSCFFMQKKEILVKKKYVIYLICAISFVWFIVHLILTSNLDKSSYGNFLASTYKAKTTAGGLIFSLISYPVEKLLTVVGAYIINAILLAVFVGLIIDYINAEKAFMHEPKKTKFDFNDIEAFELDEPKISEEEKTKRIAKRKLGLEKGESTIISSSIPIQEVKLPPKHLKPMSKRDYILTPLEPVIPPESDSGMFYDKTSSYYEKIKSLRQKKLTDELDKQETINMAEEVKDNHIEQTENHEEGNNIQTSEIDVTDIDDDIFEDDFDASEYSEIGSTYVEDNNETQSDLDENRLEDLAGYEAEQINNTIHNDEEKPLSIMDKLVEDDENLVEAEDDLPNDEEVEAEEITPNLDTADYIDQYAYNPHNDNLGSTVDSEIVRPSVDISKFKLPTIKHDLVEEPEQLEIVKEKQAIPPYVAPPVELLKYIENSYHISEEELQDNITRLEQVLEDFKVPAKVNNVTVGSAVTRYELTMPRGISVSKIAGMADDIAMTLASNGAIRVEAPIPGKTSVGIEVPNAQVSPVSLREVIDSDEFRARGNPLSFVLGKDINGDIMFCNLDKMPHLLVAGSTGSGKSVCLNTMLLSMCYKAGPEDLRLILVDPKTVEFATYSGLPHLLIPEVITNKDMTINALDWCIVEMERRYALFAKYHVVNINDFNKLEIVKNKQVEKIPYIVIVIDELADLVLESKRELEDRIAKLAAKARAAGIHLVLATQRPSVDVITGTIKTNLPSRIAFALTNYMDSKTVLDGGGAEKLLGKGDMLFKPQDKPEPKRVQGAFVSNAEIAKIVEFIKENNKPVYDEDAGRRIANPREDTLPQKEVNVEKNQEFDPVLKDALRLFIQNKQASASMISRRYSVGFNRAGRIMDQMEDAGFIGPQDGSKPRQVLINMEEYKEIFGED